MGPRFDLHIHSFFSDGSLSPEELIDQAKAIGLAGISITDHDTIDACQRAERYAKEQNIVFLRGVELSSFYQKTSVHVLAYNFDCQSSAIVDFCHRRSEQRIQRARKIFQLLAEQGVCVDFDEFLLFMQERNSCAPGRPHIAQFLQEKKVVRSQIEAFHSFIGDNKPCYHAGERSSLDDAIDMIHQSGAKAILAHPHLLPKKVFPSILEKPFDGIEVYYAKMSAAHNAKWRKIAEKKSWIITGGSDFHGPDKPINEMGSSFVGEETMQQLCNQ